MKPRETAYPTQRQGTFHARKKEAKGPESVADRCILGTKRDLRFLVPRMTVSALLLGQKAL